MDPVGLSIYFLNFTLSIIIMNIQKEDMKMVFYDDNDYDDVGAHQLDI